MGRIRAAPPDRRRSLVAAAALAALALAGLVSPPPARGVPGPTDFDADGFPDLAVGAPLDSVRARDRAGAVNVLRGARGGLTRARDRQLTQADAAVGGFPSVGDRFGAALAAGDFDGDGFRDVAIGVPGEDVAGAHDGGVVHVGRGSWRGMATTDGRFLAQGLDGIAGRPEHGDRFGAALAAGDFDGDGYEDLAIGVPRERLSGELAAGAVNVLHGSPGGLGGGRGRLWHQDTPGITASAGWLDRFGFALATGDFDGDGYDDLAIGVPGERIRGVFGAGAANLLYGSDTGLSAERHQLWSQGAVGVRGAPEPHDAFGRALVAGDVDGDGRDDLAVGVPFEGIRGLPHAGAVGVLFGGTEGLGAAANELWHQDSRDVPGGAEANDRFGWALAIGDLSRNGAGDLAVGVPGESVASHDGAGAVNVLYGRRVGLRAGPGRVWHRATPGVSGDPQPYTGFGHALAIADFGDDGAGDLAVGMPYATVAGKANAGAVHTLRGSSRGLRAHGDQLWHQGSRGIAGTPGADGFGTALAATQR